MAFMIKTSKGRASAGPINPGFAFVQQWIQIQCPAQIFPQTSTAQIFRVNGGRVLVHRLVGTIGTATTTDPVVKLSHKQLDKSSVAVGTAVDIASTAALTSKESGATITVLGSGAAFIINNAGAGIATLGLIPFVLPQGETYMTTTASQAGTISFDMWYQPLDPQAFVVAVAVPGAVAI